MISELRWLVSAFTRSAFLAFVVVPIVAAVVAAVEVSRQQWIAQSLGSLAVVHVLESSARSAWLAASVLCGGLAFWRATSPVELAPLRRAMAAVAAWVLLLVPLHRALQPTFRLLLLENDLSPLVVQVLLTMPQSLPASTALMAGAGIVVHRWRANRPRRVPSMARSLFRPRPVALVAGGALSAIALAAGLIRPTPAPGSPNLVFIVVDTLRADHLGAYGYRAHPTSPHLDRFASDGVVYEQAISSAPWTTPSVSAMFTARYPRRLGFQRVPIYLAAREATLAEVLRASGYRTHAVVSNVCASSAVGLDAGFEAMDESHIADHRDVSSFGVTDRALAWLESRPSGPFLLYLHYLDPHFAYIMHDKADFDPGYRGKFRAPLSHAEFMGSLHDMSPPDLDYVVSSYDSEIVLTDAEVGRLLEGLRKLGLYDSSMIVFTSDHGESFNDRGDHFIGHGASVQQELLRVPLLVKMPEGESAGTRIRTVVSTLDIAPTLLSRAGVKFPEAIPIDGQVLGTEDPDRMLFSETKRDADKRAVYWRNWKLLVDKEKQARSLIDLASDEGERIDVASAQPDIAQRLSEALLEWEDELGTPSGASAEFSEAQKERLEGLGYAQ